MRQAVAPPPDRGPFRPVFVALLHDADWQRLSDDAKLVLQVVMLLMPAVGFAVVYAALIAELLGWERPRVETALAELEQPQVTSGKPWLVREANVVWLRNALRFQPSLAPTNPRHRVAVQRDVAAIDARLPIAQAFRAAYPEWFDSPSDTLSDSHSDGLAIATLGVVSSGSVTSGRREKRQTWVTPFADAWRELYGGPMPVEPSLRALKTAVDTLGADEALRRWENYLAETPGNFASAARFASTLNQWAGPTNGKRAGLTSAAVATTPETLARAAVLYDLGQRYELVKFEGNRTQYAAALKRATGDPAAGETFRADFEAARLWESIADLAPTAAVTEIARRLVVAQQAAINGVGADNRLAG